LEYWVQTAEPVVAQPTPKSSCGIVRSPFLPVADGWNLATPNTAHESAAPSQRTRLSPENRSRTESTLPSTSLKCLHLPPTVPQADCASIRPVFWS
jgi:hypothetical protein